jgi:hypothetical protein
VGVVGLGEPSRLDDLPCCRLGLVGGLFLFLVDSASLLVGANDLGLETLPSHQRRLEGKLARSIDLELDNLGLENQYISGEGGCFRQVGLDVVGQKGFPVLERDLVLLALCFPDVNHLQSSQSLKVDSSGDGADP